MYYYVQSEPGFWTVGYGKGDAWVPESDHNTTQAAAARVSYLNGGGKGVDHLLKAKRTVDFAESADLAYEDKRDEMKDAMVYALLDIAESLRKLASCVDDKGWLDVDVKDKNF